MTVTWAELTSRVEEVASDWRAARPERQARRNLDPADFARLVDAGFLRVAVPEEQGGLWRSVAESTRPVAETLRTLAGADPSVALVSSMHPAVLGFWLATSRPGTSALDGAARRGVRLRRERQPVGDDHLRAGQRWRHPAHANRRRTRTMGPPDLCQGTATASAATSTSAAARASPSFMITTAVPEGEDAPTLFVLDVRDRPWDGSAGLQLTAEWDGMGMAATQSHAMRLEACPAIRFAWDGAIEEITVRRCATCLDAVHRCGPRRLRRGDPHREGATRAEGRLAAPLRAGRVVTRRARALARRAGLRGRLAGGGGGRRRAERCTRRCAPRRPSPSSPSRRSVA